MIALVENDFGTAILVPPDEPLPNEISNEQQTDHGVYGDLYEVEDQVDQQVPGERIQPGSELLV